MAFQSVPDTVQINIVYTLNGEPCMNTLYAELTGGYALADLQALATQVDIQTDASFLGNQPPDAIYVRTEVRGLADENDIEWSEDANAGPGRVASATLPNQVTFSLKKESGLTGRSARGRLFWIGIPRDKLETSDENQLTAAYVAALLVAVENQRTGIDAVGSWSPVLVSRWANGIKRSEGKTFPWINTSAVDTRVDTQRGRLPS